MDISSIFMQDKNKWFKRIKLFCGDKQYHSAGQTRTIHSKIKDENYPGLYHCIVFCSSYGCKDYAATGIQSFYSFPVIPWPGIFDDLHLVPRQLVERSVG